MSGRQLTNKNARARTARASNLSAGKITRGWLPRLSWRLLLPSPQSKLYGASSSLAGRWRFPNQFAVIILVTKSLGP